MGGKNHNLLYVLFAFLIPFPKDSHDKFYGTLEKNNSPSIIQGMLGIPKTFSGSPIPSFFYLRTYVKTKFLTYFHNSKKIHKIYCNRLKADADKKIYLLLSQTAGRFAKNVKE